MLEKVKTGLYSAQGKTDVTKQTLAIDSFTTIWFLTLPEKFAEWNVSQVVWNSSGAQATIKMNILDTPFFPEFKKNKAHTSLKLTAPQDNHAFLPDSWNLLECFEYYLKQEAIWTTKSIDNEFIFGKSVDLKPPPLQF